VCLIAKLESTKYGYSGITRFYDSFGLEL